MTDALQNQDYNDLVGRSLGNYEVIEMLGAGGMGQVYMARDTHLGRKVALKVLPAHYTQDNRRVSRFRQEARAASALNHPNILTIHEIRHVDSIHFIATELIEGETLRARLGHEPLKTIGAIDIACQVSGALSVAHEAGIVHRDIKPENIMLRGDGIVKVLDFGLAKLTEHTRTDLDASTLVDTSEGIVLGTTQYLSPEQARGRPVDARTDIWSLGCVIYEMLARRSPFAESTSGDVIVSILERDPPPLVYHAGEIPAELQRIITKTLAKNPEKRYQSAKDLLIDLENLRDELEFRSRLENSVQPAVSSEAVTVRQPVVEDTQEPAAHTTGLLAPHPTSSAKSVVGHIKHRKGVIAAAAAVLAVASIGGSWGYKTYWQSGPTKHPAAASQTMKITRLTSTGKASQAAISPDGKYVVHVASEDGLQSLRVRQVNTNSDVQKVPPAEVRYSGLTFSRDGELVLYVLSEDNNPQPTLYQIPVLGGTPRKLISNVGSAVTLSPDGRRLAFIRSFVEAGEQAVIVANVDGSGERKLAVRKFPNFFRSLAWSPDGSTIACGAGSHVPVYKSHLVEVPVEGGPEKQIPSQGWNFMGQVGWLQDGSGLILDASEQASASFDSSQIWYLSRTGGDVRRITNDLHHYSGVSLTADSSRLVTVQSETVSQIWVIPADDANRAEQTTKGAARQDGKNGVVWTPDGKIVYVSKASGNDDIWMMNADGSGQMQLTANSGINSNPAVSPDGRFIVFTSTRGGATHIWRMDINGANAKQLTSGSGENYAQFSLDGKWVVYTLLAGKTTLWRVSIEGGAPLPITERSTSAPAVSPDGKMIASIYWDEQPNSPAKIAVMPFEGGEVTKIFDVLQFNWGNVRWASDGKALAYVVTAGGVSNIWSQLLEGGAPKQLTDFKTDQIFWFDWSPDGKQIVCSRGVETNDVVLISDFR